MVSSAHSPGAVQTRPAPEGGPHTPLPHRRHKTRSRSLTVWLGVAPPALLLVAFVGYPLVQAVQLSLSRWGGVGAPKPAGLANYRQALGDAAILHSMWVTALYALLSAAGIVTIACLLGAAVSSGARGSAFYRVVWFLPGIAPASAVAIFWALSVAPGQGAVNVILGHLGLGSMHAWLASPNTALYPVIAASIWAGVGFAFLLILGAMEQIPTAVYEAARLDGASAARRFWSVTLPMIRPVLVITAMLEVIWSANGFTLVYAMTNGGPGDATMTLPVLIYKQAFQFANFGLASAMGVISGLVLIIVGLLSLRLSTSRQDSSR